MYSYKRFIPAHLVGGVRKAAELPKSRTVAVLPTEPILKVNLATLMVSQEEPRPKIRKKKTSKLKENPRIEGDFNVKSSESRTFKADFKVNSSKKSLNSEIV